MNLQIRARGRLSYIRGQVSKQALNEACDLAEGRSITPGVQISRCQLLFYHCVFSRVSVFTV